MKKSIALLATIASFAMASSASAASFLFTFSGDQGLNGASGTLEATDNGGGTYTATSGTITAFGSVATGTGSLIPGQGNSPSNFFTYDSKIFPGSTPLLDTDGLLFNIGGNEINIFSQAGSPYRFYTNAAGGSFADGNFALSEVAPVPESATWLMMLVGFGFVGMGLRSRKRQTVRVNYA